MKFRQGLSTICGIIALGCVSLPCATAQSTPDQSAAFAVDSASYFLNWAARLTRRTVPNNIQLPAWRASSTHQVMARVCPDDPNRCRRIMAAYSIERGEIIYRDSLNLDRALDRSFLVHEFVHFLQHLEQGDKLNASCRTILANEREAYAAQAAYLRRYRNNYPVGRTLRGAYCPPSSI